MKFIGVYSMIIRKKTAIILSSITAALLLFSIVLLPVIVRNQAVKILKETTGRTVQIEKVAINPFTLTVTIGGFKIQAQTTAAPLVAVTSLHASLSSASIFRRALIIDELVVNTPSISFARLADNTYSFTDIIERMNAKHQKKSGGDFHYSVNNISLNNGSIDFDDQATVGGKQHTIRDLKIVLPFVSNIPYLAETYSDPRLSAIINGAAFNFSGKVKPFSSSRETAVSLKINQHDLP